MKQLHPTINLFDHQKLGKQFILRRKYCLLGDEQGLGKTLTAIASMVEVKGIAVIICPAFLRQNWKSEIKKFSSLSCKIVTSKETYDSVPDVIISSYENVKNIPLDLMPGFVVCDESHYIKTYSSQRTKAVTKLVATCKPEYFVALSGTPIMNNVTELYTILKLLSYCPSGTNGIPIAERSQYSFSIKFSNGNTRNIRTKTKSGRTSSVRVTEFKGVKNIETLKTYLRGKYLRRLASKVLDLPKVIDVPFIVSDNKSNIDDKLMHAYESWVEGRGFEEAEHITHLKIENAMKKVPYTIKLALELVCQGEQVVVFSDNRSPVNTIVDALKEKGTKVCSILGGMDTALRQEIVDNFQEGKLQVIVGTIGAMGTGLNLTAARHMIFNDMSWVPALQSQARKRIDRIGQERKVTITNMVNGHFDKKLYEKLEEKMRNISEVISSG